MCVVRLAVLRRDQNNSAEIVVMVVVILMLIHDMATTELERAVGCDMKVETAWKPCGNKGRSMRLSTKRTIILRRTIG